MVSEPPPVDSSTDVASSKGPRDSRASQPGGLASIVNQVTGIAAVGLIIGLGTVIVPLAFHRVLYVLPIAGLLAGVQAVRGGRRVGGIIAVVLNVVGGTFTLMGVLG